MKCFIFSFIYIVSFFSTVTPACQRCGASTVFEYQVVSTLSALEPTTSHFNIGSVLIWTCSNGCFGKKKKKESSQNAISLEGEMLPDWLIEESMVFQYDKSDSEIEEKLLQRKQLFVTDA